MPETVPAPSAPRVVLGAIPTVYFHERRELQLSAGESLVTIDRLPRDLDGGVVVHDFTEPDLQVLEQRQEMRPEVTLRVVARVPGKHLVELVYTSTAVSWEPRHRLVIAADGEHGELRSVAVITDHQNQRTASLGAPIPVAVREELRLDAMPMIALSGRQLSSGAGQWAMAPVVRTLVVTPPASLAPGAIDIYRLLADQPPLFLARVASPAGGELALPLGEAEGLVARRRRLDFKRNNDDSELREVFEITVENRSLADASVVLVERLHRGPNFRIGSAATSFVLPAARIVHFSIEAPARRTVVNRYEVTYSW